MKKHIIPILIGVSLIVLIDFGGIKEKGWFLNLLQPKVASSKFESQCKTTGKSVNGPKKRVFIDWRRLHWGNLGDLTQPERYFSHKAQMQAVSSQMRPSSRNAILHPFTQELRSALRAFERRYGVKIVWRKSEQELTDVTAQFIDFWDADYACEEKGTGLLKEQGEQKS